jgi:two-component system cell cycle sensor histidine kinase/response regulator CckA
VRAVARRILQQAGYTVLEAADCDEASALARRESANIDLLLTDLVMPGMGGHELAAVVCMHAPHAAVVFMSGYSEDETRAPMSAAARRTFLAKPFDRTSLLQVVRRALDARSGRNPAMPA